MTLASINFAFPCNEDLYRLIRCTIATNPCYYQPSEIIPHKDISAPNITATLIKHRLWNPGILYSPTGFSW